MKYSLLTLLVACLLPTSALAARTTVVAPASFNVAQSLIVASSTPGNSYAAGASVVLTAPVAGDFLAFGGSVVTAAPIAGDGFILAGSMRTRANVVGDLRTVAGSVDVSEPVAGDLVALGFSVNDSGRAKGNVFVVGANVTLDGGASGPVTIYGNNVSLSGDFAKDVTVVAWGRISVAPGTTIHGKLAYEAPDTAIIPDSATIEGGVSYTNASYLPDVGTSRILAYVSIGFFLVARILGMLILAGLLAGLFPRFAELFIARTVSMRPRGMLLALLLGFAIVVATPIVIALLLLTFVGMGLALLLLILYALLLILALIYSGILVGGAFARRFRRRGYIVWHDGVLGMALLSLATLVPFIGLPCALFLMLFSVGTLLQIFFHFAFPHDEQTEEML